ncbi:MAG: hypothetical protein V7635_527, partial [Arthrobacter sp.]
AEAALDLAKLDVRLELHLRRNLMAPERYLLAHTKVLTTAGEQHVNPSRVDAYADANRLRQAWSPQAGRPSSAITALEDRASRQATAGDFPKPGMSLPRRFRYRFSPLFYPEMPTEWSELWMCVLRIFPDLPLF